MSSSPPLIVADRYRLVAPLGQGGMGRVWRATDVVLHRDVAIKELVPPPGLTPGERQEMRERSLREARAIARLNNVNVVRVFDVLRTDADPWIVMEYVASRSLHDTLASDGPFNAVRAAEIGLGVLNALRAAHRAGVVHRDVKPGNVLMGADGRVVLTDFGLATVPGDPNVTRTGLVLGSPAYIAPERARDGTAGPAADLWSLGATLYAAVEGASPFARPSAIATLAALATENPPQSRNAGPLKPVLNGLLRKDPTHRINAEEAERLLLRATGRRSKLSFPMSPTMRRPGLGRALPPTGAMPVVPGPRPPQTPSRSANPPGQTPASGGRPAAGDGRPPVFVPGKASVGRTPDQPARPDRPKADASRLEPTRVDGPPVRDGQPAFGTRPAPPPPATPPSRPGQSRPTEMDPSLARTVRGGPGGFTAADVAAARRKKAAPEHERSLADAMGHPADATTVVPPPGRTRPADATTVVPPPGRTGPADATTVVPPPGRTGPADATTVVPPPADATTVVPSPGRGRPGAAEQADATTVVPPSDSKRRSLPADATTVVPAPGRPGSGRKPAVTAPSADATTVVPAPGKPAATPVVPAAGKPDAVDATTVVSPAAGPAGAAPPAEPTTVVKHPAVTPPTDATTVVPSPSRPDTKPTSGSTPGDESREAATSREKAGPDEANAGAGRTGEATLGADTADGADADAGGRAGEADVRAGKPDEATPDAAGTDETDVRAGRAGGAEVSAVRAGAAEVGAGCADEAGPGRPGAAKLGLGRAGEAEVKAGRAGEVDADEAEEATVGAAGAAESEVEADATRKAGSDTDKAAEAKTAGAGVEFSTDEADEADEGTKPKQQSTSRPAAETRSALKSEADAVGAEPGGTDPSTTAAESADPEQTTKRGVEAAAQVALPAARDRRSAASEDGDGPAATDEDLAQVALPLARKRRSSAPKPEPEAGFEAGSEAESSEMPDDLGPFSPAARPAWNPMQPSPTFRKTAGITIFGTRLTYRQAAIGAAALLVVLVLLIVLAVKAFGGGGDKSAASSPTTGATGRAVQSGAAVPSTGSKAPSVAVSSAPPTGAAMTLPAGWKWYTRPTQGNWPGFTIPVPQNAQVDPEGGEIRIRWNNRLLLMDRTNAPAADPVQDWKDQEDGQSHRDYHKIKIVAVSCPFKACADWEFTYLSDTGNDQHAVKRNIVVSGSAAYSLNWYTTPQDWAAGQADFQNVYQGFQPKP
jgi:serine/threonine protein kinase